MKFSSATTATLGFVVATLLADSVSAVADCDNSLFATFSTSATDHYQCSDLGTKDYNTGLYLLETLCDQQDFNTGTLISDICGRQCKSVSNNGCSAIYSCDNAATQTVKYNQKASRTCNNVSKQPSGRCLKIDEFTGYQVAEVCGEECTGYGSGCNLIGDTPDVSEPANGVTAEPTKFTMTVEATYNLYGTSVSYNIVDLMNNNEVIATIDVGSIAQGETQTFEFFLPESCYYADSITVDEYTANLAITYETTSEGAQLWTDYDDLIGPLGHAIYFGYDENICDNI